MLIKAVLTMPNVGSWNGKWSGENNEHSKKINVRKAEMHPKIYEKLKNGEKVQSYYDFGDGWGASVTLKKVTYKEKATDNFLRYEWMIYSLLKNGEIKKRKK